MIDNLLLLTLTLENIRQLQEHLETSDISCAADSGQVDQCLRQDQERQRASGVVPLLSRISSQLCSRCEAHSFALCKLHDVVHTVVFLFVDI